MTARPLVLDRPVLAQPTLLWIGLILLPGLWALLARPPLPVDETRYLTVAWEMWLRQDFLVPHLNGMAYSHKPPVLFWLINLGWGIFGVNEWWPRLLGPLSSLAATALTVGLARRLWPLEPDAAARVPWLLAGALGWLVFGQMLMFDMLLTVSVVAGLTGIWLAGRDGRAAPWLLVAGAIGTGLLIKGPVVFVHVLLPAVLAPLWSSRARARPGAWLTGCLLASLVGTAIAALWALPAARAGGADYADAILWGQTAGRMVESFAHARGPWFYLLALPAMVLPWALMPSAWRSAGRNARASQGGAFLLTWLGSVLLGLTLISGKQPHYLLPLLPALALLLARGSGARAGDPGRETVLRQVALVTVVGVLSLATVWFQVLDRSRDLRAAAAAVAAVQRTGAAVTTLGHDKGQLGFLGRLPRPMPDLAPADAGAWSASHPGGWLLLYGGQPPAGLPLVERGRYPYRRDAISLWQVQPTSTGPAAAGGD